MAFTLCSARSSMLGLTFFFCAFLFSAFSLTAQLRLDHWQTHTSMYDARSATTDSKGTVWIGTSGGIFTYDPSTQLYNTFRNIDALLSLDVTTIRANTQNDDIFVGCSDGMVSVYSNGQWKHITAIAAKSSEFASVQINDFLFDGERVFIAGDFGITIYDNTTETFGITITNFNGIRNIAVYNLLAAQNRLWINTSAGVFSAPLQAQALNLPSIWKPYNFKDITTANTPAKGLVEYQNSIYTGYGKTLWKLGGTEFEPVASLDTTITSVVAHGETLFFSDLYQTVEYPNTSLYNRRSSTNQIRGLTILPPSLSSKVGILLSQKGLLYPANDGFAQIVPNSPQSNLFLDLAVARDGSVWAATEKDFAASGFFRLHNGTWTNFTKERYPALQTDAYVKVYTAPDETIWASSWGSGLAHLVPQADTFAITLYDTSNSPIKGIFPSGGTSFEVMGESITDGNGTTWILYNLQGAGSAYLLALDKDKQFTPFLAPSSLFANWYYTEMAIDQAGTKWLGSREGEPFLYFNDRNTFTTTADDIWGQITSTGTALTSTQIYDLAVDKNGALWIAGEKGLYVIDNPTAVLSKSRLFTRVVPALSNQLINCVMVDALNQKWVGTNTGVWILNDDGTEVLANLTKKNTPLLDDKITSLATDENTGLIFIGTRSGLLSVQSLSVRANLDFNSLRCYPQPFVPTVDAELFVEGLAEKATVKVSTVDGVLVRTIDSKGSRVVAWDGRDDKGNIVPSGVYLISGSSATSGETAVAKAMVLHKE